MQGAIPEVPDGSHMEDMGLLVVQKFKMGGYVAFYVISLLFLGFHLDHAFQSALQSIGLNNHKYMGFLKVVSRLLAIVLTVGFISIPLVIYFQF